jgi:hypothetical protein
MLEDEETRLDAFRRVFLMLHIIYIVIYYEEGIEGMGKRLASGRTC